MTSTTSTAQLSQRRFLLKFGGKNLPSQRIEVRDGNFELVGICAADDWDKLLQLVGPDRSIPTLQLIISDLPVGILSPIPS